MKALFTFFSLLFVLVGIAQNGINYKALIKDANGDVIANQAVTIQFQILENGTTNVYQETHNPTTDANGIAIVNIGEGSVDSGNFLTIEWGAVAHYLNVQIDTGSGLVDLGTTAFKSVPYAFMAENVRNPAPNVSEFALAKSHIVVSQPLNSAPTKLNFGDEAIDLTNNYDTTLQRFTVTEAGYYEIKSAVTFQGNDSNEDYIVQIDIYKNGTKIRSVVNRINETDNYFNTISISSIENLVPGDYIEIFGTRFQGNVTAGSGALYSIFEIARIR